MPQTFTATAHKLGRVIYRMLRFSAEYVDRGQDYCERRYQPRVLFNLTRAEELGYRLIKSDNLPTTTSPA